MATILRLKDENGNVFDIPALVGPRGPKGADGTMTFADLTAEQKASLKGDKGDKGDTGSPGAAGANATINGVNTLTIKAGTNITLTQSGSTLTINASGGSAATAMTVAQIRAICT